jgi:hypothetical protein
MENGTIWSEIVEGISNGDREWKRNSYRRAFVHEGTISALLDGREHPGS